MKKLMFSAVALVAFSFAGMANEVKEIETTKSKEEVVVVEDGCVQESFDAVEAFENSLGIKLSPSVEGMMILMAYDLCDQNR
ncbi:hypothetical protein [Flavobacterium sp.]|uniref:hypothetical protein n=1 Tax=Flavobacterium sp. TaxID=239 RepID=UPI004048B0FA